MKENKQNFVTIEEDIKIQNIDKTFASKIKKLLTIDNPDYIKKVRMGFYLGRTPKTINLYVEKNNTLIIPYGLKSRVLAFLNKARLEYQVIDKSGLKPIKITEKDMFEPYDYQEPAINEVIKHTNGILIAPCGSGKTFMGLKTIKDRSQKTLWLTHTHDLLQQSKKMCEKMYDNEIGTITDGKVDIKDITFATVQTMAKLDLRKMRNDFGYIIVDECHNVTGSPTRLSMFYKVITNLNARYMLGLTATLFDKEHDISSTPLYLIGEKLYEILEEDIPRVDAKHIVVELNTKTSNDYLKADYTIDYSKLVDYIINDDERNERIVDELVKYKNNYNIVLSTRNAHLDTLKAKLEHLGYDVGLLIGKEKKAVRKEILDDFKEGKFHFLLSNYQLAKEGLDIPRADVMHWVFPIKEKKTVVQSKGRVERTFEGKENAYVIDYVDSNIGYFKNIANIRRRILK